MRVPLICVGIAAWLLVFSIAIGFMGGVYLTGGI